jgi:four helix bundle protein
MGLKNFRAYQLAVKFYHICERLHCPKHLREQLSRASSSIALNLSEGSARPTRKDRRRFYYIAFGSLRETQTVLDLLKLPQNHEVNLTADQLGGQIYRLLQALRNIADIPTNPEHWP